VTLDNLKGRGLLLILKLFSIKHRKEENVGHKKRRLSMRKIQETLLLKKAGPKTGEVYPAYIFIAVLGRQ